MSSVTDKIRDLNFFELHNVLFDNKYYEILFPFLLIFALLYTVLCKVKIFQYKSGDSKGLPIKSVVTVISVIVSFFAVSFEISDKGYTLGNLMMMMFPNISALTIGILCLYIAGSIFAKDFFAGLFKPNHSAFVFIAVGGIGLGSVIYYLGIVMGFWDPSVMNNQSQWNVILAVIFLILGVVFMFVEMAGYGAILLFVFANFVMNYGEDVSILEYFVDPIIFIMVIVTLLFTWVSGSSDERIKELERKLAKDQKSFDKDYKGKEFAPYKNKIYDIRKASLDAKKEEIAKLKSEK